MIISILFNLFYWLPVLCTPHAGADADWTWRYKKVMSVVDRQRHHAQSCVLLSKIEVPPFTQLIFSWNSFRPKHGYFRFSCQARDAKSKKWYQWHRMSEWGATAQRSFFTQSDSGTTFHHVRLEMPVHVCADAFKIKIESVNRADLADICALFVTISNFYQFEPQVADSESQKFAPCCIKGLPSFSQMVLCHPKKEVLCSPTACSMLLSYWMKKKIEPVFFAAHAFDAGLDAYGSWPFNMASAFELGGGLFTWQVTRLKSFQELCTFLARGIPVAVSVRGWLTGAPQEYKNGHLMCVYGYDAQRSSVLCHDPAFNSDEKAIVSYPVCSFLSAWDRSRRLAYIAEPVHDPFQSPLK
jgi:hypothetical protein